MKCVVRWIGVMNVGVQPDAVEQASTTLRHDQLYNSELVPRSNRAQKRVCICRRKVTSMAFIGLGLYGLGVHNVAAG
jgi:hypothetical protein